MFWLRILPWWVLLPISLACFVLFATFLRIDQDYGRALEGAIDNAPPVVAASELPNLDYASSIREFAAVGFRGGAAGRVETSFGRRSYLALELDSVDPTLLVFVSVLSRLDEHEAVLRAVRDDPQGYVVRGLWIADSLEYNQEVFEPLTGLGLYDGTQQVFSAELLVGERETALRNRNKGAVFVLALLAAAGCFFGGLSVFRFRRWRRRVAARRNAEAPVFADSPIQSVRNTWWLGH